MKNWIILLFLIFYVNQQVLCDDSHEQEMQVNKPKKHRPHHNHDKHWEKLQSLKIPPQNSNQKWQAKQIQEKYFPQPTARYSRRTFIKIMAEYKFPKVNYEIGRSIQQAMNNGEKLSQKEKEIGHGFNVLDKQ